MHNYKSVQAEVISTVSLFSRARQKLRRVIVHLYVSKKLTSTFASIHLTLTKKALTYRYIYFNTISSQKLLKPPLITLPAIICPSTKKNNFHLTSWLYKLLTPAVLDCMWDLFLAKQRVWGSPYRMHPPRGKTENAEVRRTPAESRYQVMMFAVLTWVSFLTLFLLFLRGRQSWGAVFSLLWSLVKLQKGKKVTYLMHSLIFTLF